MIHTVDGLVRAVEPVTIEMTLKVIVTAVVVCICVASKWNICTLSVNYTDDATDPTDAGPHSRRDECFECVNTCRGSGVLRPQGY